MNQRIKHVVLLIIGSFLIFVPFLGHVHLFDWDEINFAESAREMLASGNYNIVQINYTAFWEKPPLFIWMQSLSMYLLGVNEFAARLPNAICGIITLLVLYRIGRKLYDAKFALFWVLAYSCSILPLIYFKSGIIDPWFNLFIFIALYFIIRFKNEEIPHRALFVIYSASFLGLAILTKGPVALIITGLVGIIYFLTNKYRFPAKIWHIILFIIVLITVGGAWFIYMSIQGNYEIIQDFLAYQIRLFQTKDAGHGGFLLYHPVILYFGVFPASVIALHAYRNVHHDTLYQRDFHKWMKLLFWVVLILFTIVQTKIVHYSSLCYFPITYFAAWVAYQVSERRLAFRKPLKTLLLVTSCILTLFVIVLTNISIYKKWLINSNLIHDQFALANLNAPIVWNGMEWLIALLLPLGVVVFIILQHKKQLTSSFLSLYVSTLIFSLLTLYIITPKIEGYSQRAAINFYKSIKDKNCYVCTVGFKSYASLYYSKRPYFSNKETLTHDSLLYGKIDKPVYLIIKSPKKDEFLSKNPSWKFIYERNGFVFCIRYQN